MLRARASNGVIILGLDNEDIKLLRGGFPILADAKAMGCEDEIVVMYGANFAHIKSVLEVASGMPLVDQNQQPFPDDEPEDLTGILDDPESD
jgi:hypothetical protein